MHRLPSFVSRLGVLALLLAMLGFVQPVAQPLQEVDTLRRVVIDDFEAYRDGDLPTNWQYLQGRTLVPVSPEVMSEKEQFFVTAEGRNKFVRARVTDQAHRILLKNGESFDWDIEEWPRLRWDWRAIQLPRGAREDHSRFNDTGAALYVYFDRDWLGRPKGIKYTYSSMLPVGTELSFGALKVVVVSSAADGTGEWRTIERDVRADYERLFGKPPDEPSVLALWSDSDNTGDTAVADFDNLMLLSER